MQIRLNNARLAFPALFTPKSVNGGDPSFSAALIIPPNHPQVAEIRKAIDAVATEKWKGKKDVKIKQADAKDRNCLHDGDLKADLDGYAGNLYINANSKVRPLVIDKDRSQLAPEDGKPYAGCYVNAVIDIWVQDNEYGVGINAQLKGIQFFRDGDAFSGGGTPASQDDFDDISDTGEGDAAQYM